MTTRWLSIGLPILLCAGSALAQDALDPEGCVHERVIHPEGAERCENGHLLRCEDGAWADIGNCRAPVPAPDPPNDEGGDVSEP